MKEFDKNNLPFSVGDRFPIGEGKVVEVSAITKILVEYKINLFGRLRTHKSGINEFIRLIEYNKEGS